MSRSILVLICLAAVGCSPFKSERSVSTQLSAAHTCSASASTSSQVSEHIINGVDVSEVKPWMVSLHYAVDGRMVFACGGALIDKKWVLTAGHCLTPIAKYGFPYLRFDSIYKDNIGHQVRAKGAFAHERYNEETLENDIGLIELSAPVGLKTAKILSQSLWSGLTPKLTGDDFSLYGWGLNARGTEAATLQVAQTKLHSFRACQQILDTEFSHLSEEERRLEGFYDEHVLCFKDQAMRSGSCNGDSGGPAIYHGREGDYVVGVSSFGFLTCPERAPVYYTNIQKHLTWLQQKVSSLVIKDQAACGL